MTIAFADAGFWIAITNPQDELHDKALATSKELAPLRVVTTEMVLVEFLNYFSKWSLRGTAIQAVQRIVSDSNMIVIPQTREQFARACRDYETYQDKGWSVTDCASFNAMEDHSVSIALAHDKHFEQRGYVAALRDGDS